MSNFLRRLHSKLLSENLGHPCKMFWCIPMPTESNDVVWEPMVFDADGDDLSNWLIVIHKLKKEWGNDFDQCKDSHSGLPRGIMIDNILYHGNNLPPSVELSSIASAMGGKLGQDITPMYNGEYGISREDLARIEEIVGRELGLQYTD